MKKKVIRRVIKKALGALVGLDSKIEELKGEIKTLQDRVWDLEEDANNNCIDARVSDLEDVFNNKGDLRVEFKREPWAMPPIRAHKTDAGLDLFASKDYTVGDLYDIESETFLIDTGIHVNIPEGYVGLICPRSGMAREGRAPYLGVIDAGYTGSIKVCFDQIAFELNTQAPDVIVIEDMERIAQLVILPLPKIDLVEVNQFPETERGDHGFGSTWK